MGLTCSSSDITPTKKSLLEREGLIAKLQEALEEVNLLSGLLSICASCKRIKNERDTWEPLRVISNHTRSEVLAWSMSGLPAKTIPWLLSGIGARAAENGLTRSPHLPARNVTGPFQFRSRRLRFAGDLPELHCVSARFRFVAGLVGRLAAPAVALKRCGAVFSTVSYSFRASAAAPFSSRRSASISRIG